MHNKPDSDTSRPLKESIFETQLTEIGVLFSDRVVVTAFVIVVVVVKVDPVEVIIGIRVTVTAVSAEVVKAMVWDGAAIIM